MKGERKEKTDPFGLAGILEGMSGVNRRPGGRGGYPHRTRQAMVPHGVYERATTQSA